MSAEAQQGEANEQKEKDRANNKNAEARNKIHKEYAAALDHEGMHTHIKIQ